MRAIDTNVLVRVIVKDNEAQAKKALSYIKKHRHIFISQIVLCEAIWVFDSVYDFTKDELIMTIENILKTEQFEIENANLFWLTLTEFKHKNIDFTDCLIGITANYFYNAKVATFDKKAAKSSFF